MRWSVFIGLGFAIALGVSFQACSKAERRYFAESCASNSECESNLCIAGLCSKSCVNDAACGGGVWA